RRRQAVPSVRPATGASPAATRTGCSSGCTRMPSATTYLQPRGAIMAWGRGRKRLGTSTGRGTTESPSDTPRPGRESASQGSPSEARRAGLSRFPVRAMSAASRKDVGDDHSDESSDGDRRADESDTRENHEDPYGGGPRGHMRSARGGRELGMCQLADIRAALGVQTLEELLEGGFAVRSFGFRMRRHGQLMRRAAGDDRHFETADASRTPVNCSQAARNASWTVTSDAAG